MRVYLDNAATTPMDERVFEAMKPYLVDHFGNPSSIHQYGREVRSAVEKARKQIADILTVAPSEIFFTSGGTEADNTIINNAIEHYGITHAIISKIEHHAVLHTLEHLEKAGKIKLHFVKLDAHGMVDYDDLEKLLSSRPNAFVSLMHANNEIGNITDLERVGDLCREFGAYFHSDTVQSLGHVDIDLSKLHIDAIAGSAHKFHGPKGGGIMYLNAEKQIPPLLIGGGQERNMRGGTENVAGIIGLAKALELSYAEKESSQKKLLELKRYTIQLLKEKLDAVSFNGRSADSENSLHKILSIAIKGIEDNDMLLFNLDINGIAVSGGSACASGTSIGSHVLDALDLSPGLGTLRVSFSKFNTIEEVDYLIEKLVEILASLTDQ